MPRTNKSSKRLDAKTKQTIKNIEFCIDHCGMNDDEIGEMLRAIEKLHLTSVQHFCEEFVFIAEGTTPKENLKYHHDDFFNIAEFNAMYWGQNQQMDT